MRPIAHARHLSSPAASSRRAVDALVVGNRQQRYCLISRARGRLERMRSAVMGAQRVQYFVIMSPAMA